MKNSSNFSHIFRLFSLLSSDLAILAMWYLYVFNVSKFAFLVGKRRDIIILATDNLTNEVIGNEVRELCCESVT
jgi:hypothetical protein